MNMFDMEEFFSSIITILEKLVLEEFDFIPSIICCLLTSITHIFNILEAKKDAVTNSIKTS